MHTFLRDGRHLEIRPIEPSDRFALAAGLTHLSPASQYSRFLSPKPRLSSAELRYLTEVDGYDHLAYVAIDDAGYLQAVGRYVRDRVNPEQAEVAITVADELHGMGLGTTIGLALADAARVRDVRQFTATMLPDNTASLRLFERLSDHLTTEIHGGVRELVADIAA